jgi:molybdopterin-guanine dinucleotide biosynthesis protein A
MGAPPGDRASDEDPRDGVVGIVLAGGRSRRFGRDKLHASIGGLPLLHRPIRSLAAVASEVVVVVGFGAPDPDLPDVPGASLRVTRDRVADQGPLAGVDAGLATAHRSTVVVAAGDMPSIVPGVLRAMLDALHALPGVDALVLPDPIRRQPLPLVGRTVAVRRATGAGMASGERSLHGLLGRLVVQELPAAAWRALDPAGTSTRDVDRPEDIEPPNVGRAGPAGPG